MKKPILLALVFLFVYNLHAQVGIGVNSTTPHTSSVLDVSATNKGVLFPRVALINITDVTTVNDPANGLLVYNTSTNASVFPGFYYYSRPERTWKRFVSGGVRKSVKYDILDSSTNINTNEDRSTGRRINPFGRLEWNDDNSLFVVSGNRMTVTRAGRYKINVNCFITKSNRDDKIAPKAQLMINGSRRGTEAQSKNMTEDDHDHTSLRLMETLQLNAGDYIQIDMRAGGKDNDPAYLVTSASLGYPSNIIITKVK